MKVYQRYFYFVFLLTLVLLAACSTVPTTTTNINSNAATVTNANSNNAAANSVAISSPAAGVASPGASPSAAMNAGSPSATVAAYYQSMVKKDEMGFRQVLSKATLSEFSADARADGEKKLVDYWTSYSSPPKQTYETRNERISGDTALLEVKDSDTGKWSLTKLVRENGEWKLDLTNATVESLLEQSK